MNLATAVEFQSEIARLQAEIDRLRLTDDERDAIETAAMEADAHQHAQRAATLRGLLERTNATA